MISHADFEKLHLAHFRSDAEIADLEDWEFEDRIWAGEAIGFSEWLRPEDEPDVLQSQGDRLPGVPARRREPGIARDRPADKGRYVVHGVEATARQTRRRIPLRFGPDDLRIRHTRAGVLYGFMHCSSRRRPDLSRRHGPVDDNPAGRNPDARRTPVACPPAADRVQAMSD